MIITIEVELVADYHEYDNGTVRLDGLHFNNCTQNILQFLSPCEQDQAQQALEDEVEKAAMDKVQRLLEKKAMGADHRRDMAREFQREALAEREAQRGVRL